jgi:hypothetical protein
MYYYKFIKVVYDKIAYKNSLMTSKNHISYKKTIVIRNLHTSKNVEIIASDFKISIFLSIELESKDEQASYY